MKPRANRLSMWQSFVMARYPLTGIINDGKVPSDWEQSLIVCLYKGKGDALEKGNYRGLKLTEQVMKILERIVDGLIRQLVSSDDSQFGFVPGRGTTDTAAREVSSCQQETLHGFRRPGEGVWSSTSEGHLVGAEKTLFVPASAAQLDAPSDWRPGGCGFNPDWARQHSFIDHEIFSTVILSVPLIQEGQLSVSGERMCTILVNHLED